MKRIKGYNIILKIGEKQLAGVTDDSFNLTPYVVESQTKDQAGVKERVANGYDYDFSVSGIMSITEEGDLTFTGRDEIMQMAKAGTPVEFMYGAITSGSKVQKGTAIISGYSETTPADGSNGTYTLNLQGSSALEEATLPL